MHGACVLISARKLGAEASAATAARQGARGAKAPRVAGRQWIAACRPGAV